MAEGSLTLSPTDDVISKWKDHELLGLLVAPGEFDHTAFLRQTMDNHPQDFYSFLLSCSQKCQSDVKERISENLGDILSHSSSLLSVKSLLAAIDHTSRGLRSDFNVIHSKLGLPLATFSRSCIKLKLLESLSLCLRNLLRLISIINRTEAILKENSSFSRVPLAAQSVCEAQAICDSNAFSGSRSLVSTYVIMLQNLNWLIIDLTKKKAEESLSRLDQSDLSLCLDVQNSFSNLKGFVESLVDEKLAVAQKLVDTLALSSKKEPEKFTELYEQFLWKVLPIIAEVHCLESSLKRAFGRSFQEGYLNGLSISSDLVSQFWSRLIKHIEAVISSISGTKSSTLGSLGLDYVKISVISQTFSSRLSSIYHKSLGKSDGIFQSLIGAFGNPRNYYVSLVIQSLNEPIELMYAKFNNSTGSEALRSASIPTLSDMSTYVTVIVGMLEDSKRCPELQQNVLKAISGSVLLYSQKTSEIVDLVKSFDPRVKGSSNTEERRAAGHHEKLRDLFNNLALLELVTQSIVAADTPVMEGYDRTAIHQSSLNKCIIDLVSVCKSILDSLLSSSKTEILKAFHGLHSDETMNNPDLKSEGPPKLILKVAEEFAFIQRHLVAKFDTRASAFQLYLKSFFESIVKSFVYNASVLCMNEEYSCTRLVEASVHLETSLRDSINYFNVSLNVAPVFKSLRGLLTRDFDDIISSPDLSTLPVSRIGVFQILMSKQTVYRQPYQLMSYSPAKFAIWESMRSEHQVIEALVRLYSDSDPSEHSTKLFGLILSNKE